MEQFKVFIEWICYQTGTRIEVGLPWNSLEMGSSEVWWEKNFKDTPVGVLSDSGKIYYREKQWYTLGETENRQAKR